MRANAGVFLGLAVLAGGAAAFVAANRKLARQARVRLMLESYGPAMADAGMALVATLERGTAAEQEAAAERFGGELKKLPEAERLELFERLLKMAREVGGPDVKLPTVADLKKWEAMS